MSLCFSCRLINFHENGLLTIWKQRWWPKEDVCLDMNRTKANAITLIDIQSAFYLAGIGLFLTVLALISEKIVTHLREMKMSKA